MQTKEYSINLAGKEIIARFTDLADQANGSVILESEGTVVMATAVISKDGKRNPGFFNLTVEYMEKFYAAGLILGSQYNHREGRPSDKAVLGSRVIDRTIRPLFEKHIKNAVQVILTVVAVGKADPVILAVNAASLALATSDIPWGGPVGAVHISKSGNGLEVNNYIPKEKGVDPYTLDMTICGKGGTINMIETMAFEDSEEEIGKAFDLAVEEITKLEEWQNKIVSEIGKEKKVFPKPELPAGVAELFTNEIEPRIGEKVFDNPGMSKDGLHELEHEWELKMDEMFPEDEVAHGTSIDYFHKKFDELLHVEALQNKRRADGRALDEVRNIFAKAGGISPVLHGSGIFYRGETHVLSVLTLGGPKDALTVEGMELRDEKSFMHHYNFPPYSAGETGRVGGFNRRELGHGMLAEKALYPVIPSKEKFPYTIRLVSESTASNGSTSQASICASSVSLMDGGVPITRPVAGIAMGAMLSDDGKDFALLTDIQGPEDHHGDMDFKVAGTREGVTAIQLDIKVGGMPVEVLKAGLEGAKKARLGILDVMEAEISSPRDSIAPSAPKIVSYKIKEDQIGMVIGKGGETIQGLQEETGAEISIEDDGTVIATGKDGSAEAAIAKIKDLTKEWGIGEKAEAIITKIMDFGAFAKLPTGHEGLIHVSEIANFRIENVGEVLAEGQTVPVVVKKIERGKIGLSIKDAQADFVKPKEEPKK
jgi:polyribonucleotide nucleotidyltransferase